MWQLLKFIQFAFEQMPTCVRGKVANKDATDLYQQNRPDYLAKVKECIRVSRDKIYDQPAIDDRHYITFDRFDSNVHGPTLESIKKQKNLSLSPPASGVSWLV